MGTARSSGRARFSARTRKMRRLTSARTMSSGCRSEISKWLSRHMARRTGPLRLQSLGRSPRCSRRRSRSRSQSLSPCPPLRQQRHHARRRRQRRDLDVRRRVGTGELAEGPVVKRTHRARQQAAADLRHHPHARLWRKLSTTSMATWFDHCGFLEPSLGCRARRHGDRQSLTQIIVRQQTQKRPRGRSGRNCALKVAVSVRACTHNSNSDPYR